MKLYLLTILLSIAVLPSSQAQTCSQGYGPLPCPPPTASAPIWGKLVVSGDVVTCYYATGATTPTIWTQIGPPQTIGFLNDPLLIGIYITSHNSTSPNAGVSTGTIDNFSISPAPTYRIRDQDVGAPELMGSANLTAGVWTISGSGTDIWGASDQFNFQPWLVTGDCTVICRITSISSGDPWQKIGIMVRDGFNSGSDYALFCASLGHGVDFQYRLSFNDNSDAISYVAPSVPGAVSGTAIGTGLVGNFQGPYLLRP